MFFARRVPADRSRTVTLSALGLVLASGFLHAAWNLLAKRASGDASGAAFVWLYSALSTVIFAPLAAAVVVEGERAGPMGLFFMLGTGVLHIGYFLSLQKGYQVGDLSVVYPLARGVGPLLASGTAILLFGESAGPVTVAGILLIVFGVFLLAWEPNGGRRSPRERRLGVAFGLLTGVFIAAYTLWDKSAVSDLSLSPVLYYWGSLLVQTVVLLPVALRRRGEVRAAWRARRPETLGVAVLSPTGLRNPCKQLDDFRPGLMRAVLDRDEEGYLVRKAGIMAVVLAGGEVRPGDPIRVELPAETHRPLERV